MLGFGKGRVRLICGGLVVGWERGGRVGMMFESSLWRWGR